MQIDSRKELRHYTPHSGAMLFIDRVLEQGEDHIVTEVDVSRRLPGFSGEGVPAYIVIELMAQSIAAWSGLRRNMPDSAPPIGFLLGTRKFSCQKQILPVGVTLQITARQVIENEGMAQFECQMDIVSEDWRETGVAQANVSVFSEPETEKQLITG